MKRWVGLISVFLVLQLLLPVSAREPVVLKVGIYQNEPKVFVDSRGKPAGLWVDLLEHIAREEHWKLEYVTGTWQQCLNRLEQGELDILPDVGYSEERARRFRFNQETVLSNWARVYVHESQEIETVEALRNKRVAAMRGDISFERFKRFNIPCTFVLCDGYRQVFQAMDQGGADAGIISRLYGQVNERRYPVQKTSIILAPMELRFAFPRDGSPKRIVAIDQHLAGLKRNPKSFYHQTLDEWFSERIVRVVPREVKAALMVAVILVAVFAVLILLLRKRVLARTLELEKRNRDLEQEISQRARAEARLRKDEELLRMVGELGKIGGWEFDARTFKGTWTEAVAEIHDMSLQEGTDVEIGFSVYQGESRRKIEAAVNEALTLGKPYDLELEMTTPKGNRKWVRTIGKPVKDGGDVVKLRGSIQDISSIKKAEKDLRESENRYRVHFENISDIIYSLDSELRLTDISPSVERILGYRPDELLGRPISDLGLLAPEEVDRAAMDAARLFEGEQKGSDVYCFLTKDGKRVFGEVTSRRIQPEQGGPVVISSARDVTDRVKAESDLRESEALFRAIFESASDRILVWDREYNCLYANRAAVEHEGMTTEQVIGKNIREGFEQIPDLMALWMQRVDWVFETGEGMRVEDRVASGEGTAHIESVISPIRDPENRLFAVGVVYRDMTERKTLETDLARQKDLLAAINRVLVNSVVSDSEEKIARICLETAEEITGSPFGFVGEINEKGRFDTIAQSDSGWEACRMPGNDKVAMIRDMVFRGFWGRILEQGRSRIVNDPASDPDHTELPEGHPPITSFLGVPLLREEKVLGMIALANKAEAYREVDQQAVEQLCGVFLQGLERIRAQQALKDHSANLESMVQERTRELSEAHEQVRSALDRLDAIVASVADGLIVTNHQARVVLMNPAAETLLGFRFSEIKGQPVYFGIQDRTLKTLMGKALEEREPGYQFDFAIPASQSSRPRILRAKTARIQGGTKEGDVMVLVISDVTNEREIDRIKTEFLSTAAHELRTPLTSIQGFSEILMHRQDLEPERRKKYLSYINSQAVSLAGIIGDLLDVSRIESGKGVTLHREAVDVKTFIERTARMYRSKSPSLVFETNLPEGDLSVLADRDKLQQVMDNLLSNALKYSPGGGTIRITAWVGEGKEKGELEKETAPSRAVFIRVEDEGIGMTSEQVERAFEKFWRADASNTYKASGCQG